MKENTNFNILNSIVKMDDRGNILRWNCGLSPKNKRNYLILKSVINRLENHVHVRDYSDKKLDFRIVSEVLNLFIYTEVFESKPDDLSTERKYLYSTLREEWVNFKTKSKVNPNKWKIHHFNNVIRELDLITDSEMNELIEFNILVNSEVHIIDESDMKKPINGFFIGENFIINPITFREYISMLGKLFDVIKVILRVLYPDLLFNDEFLQIYNDGMMSLDNVKNWDEFEKIAGEECVICNNGKLFMPESKLLPNGPFMICDNSNCEAKLSVNLNLKESNGNFVKCEYPDCNGKYKKTASYDEKSSHYKRPFLQCNFCKEFGE